MCAQHLKENITELNDSKDKDAPEQKCMAMKMFGTCLVKNSPFEMTNLPFEELKMLQVRSLTQAIHNLNYKK